MLSQRLADFAFVQFGSCSALEERACKLGLTLSFAVNEDLLRYADCGDGVGVCVNAVKYTLAKDGQPLLVSYERKLIAQRLLAEQTP